MDEATPLETGNRTENEPNSQKIPKNFPPKIPKNFPKKFPKISQKFPPKNSVSYLAEDVDEVAPLEGELVGIVPAAIPQSLVVIGIIPAGIFWGKGRRKGVRVMGDS